MKLTNEDYNKIAEMIERGKNSIEYAKGEEVLYLECTYEVEGYVEDDYRCGYENGTGAFVETDRYLTVKDAVVSDGENEEPIWVDANLLESMVA